MKKVFLILMIAVCFLFVSCTEKENTICCGYFEDSAVALIYSPQDNTLYEIELPLKQMLSWAALNSVSSFQETCEGFLNLYGQYYFSSVPSTRRAINQALEIISERTLESQSELLEAFLENIQILSQSPIMAKINKICNADLTGFFSILRMNNPDLMVINSEDFAGEDPEKSAEYFRLWLGQLFE